MIQPIHTAGALSAPEVQRSSPSLQGEPGGFARLIERALESTNAQQTQASQAVRELAMGQTENVHNVLLEVAKADMSFRLVLEIRNRLMEAYQEVMRMQV